MGRRSPHRRIARGWVKISNPSPRAMATSVMPAASAIRTASAVGAETATMTGAPMAAVFCTSSTDTRLVSSTMPSLADVRRPAPARRPACRAHCGGRRPRAARLGRAPASRMPRRGLRASDVDCLRGATSSIAAMISRGVKIAPVRRRSAAGARLLRDFDAAQSAAGRPADAGAARRSRGAGSVSHMRSSTPTSLLDDLEGSISRGDRDDALGPG